MSYTPKHPQKVLWKKLGYTKADLLGYYEMVAPVLLPYVKGHPLSLNRYPEGIEGFHFFQKDLGDQRLPSFVKTIDIRAKSTGKNVRYALCENLDTLLYVADLGSIELHPWASRKGSLDKPLYLVFDLDPGTKSTYDDVVEVAQVFRSILASIGIESACKTSGKRGLHVYAPLQGKYPFKEVRAFALMVCQAVEKALPKKTTVEQRIAKRGGRVYLDYTRNSQSQTMVAPYSVRPTQEATVSAPLEWKEVKKGLDPKRFTIKTMEKRLKAKGDLWKAVRGKGANLTQAVRLLKSKLL